MRAGALQHVLTVERETITVDAAGERSSAWTTVATLRAELVDALDREQPREPGASTDAVVTFKTRFHPSVSTGDRLLFRDGVHEIVEVSEHGRRRDLEIRCSTRRM